MAISDLNKAYCFEILEAYFANDGAIHDGFGTQLSLTELDQLKAEIETRLDALTGAVLTIVEALCTEWIPIRLGAMKMDAGSNGVVTGLSIDFEKEQAIIRKRLLTYVPVMHIADSLKQKRGPAGSTGVQIPFLRC